jgi:hypothetical protein
VDLVPLPTGLDVVNFLGRSGDPPLLAIATDHVKIVTAFCRAYTRGQGFDDPDLPEEVTEDLRAVIVAATARLLVNPSQVEREEADGYSVVGSFRGFTLPELVVLNGYRKRMS